MECRFCSGFVVPVIAAHFPYFLYLHLPAAMLLGPMIAGIVLSLRGSTLQLPRGIFLAAQAILGCMIAQNLTGSILTTLALYWPVVLLCCW